MGKKTKLAILIVLALIVLSYVWFDFFFLKINGEKFEKELMKAGEESDVVIVFNSGGWGTVPLDRAFDINPIIEETKKLIEESGHKVSIVQYFRTEDTFFAKISTVREVFFNFPGSSKVFAERIKEFRDSNPEDKVVMAGLSNGAAFVDAAMGELKDDNVFAIELGAPFWKKNVKNENILSLNNQADILANGKLGELLWSVVKAPFIWAGSNLSGKRMSFGEAVHIDGHDYYWPALKGELAEFIEERAGL
ncbi:MAG: hypothetical protein PHH21_00770 [Candidatus Pacebacteria bacterium]|nr:hypothetical protein [Candidatus Paceibacterota bacterium]